jgi:hypothetical protein
MSKIVYSSLSALSPVELRYSYHKDEYVKKSLETYNNGISLYETPGLENYRDVSINKNTCFVLTSAIDLNNFFSDNKIYALGQLPGSFLLQPRSTTAHFALYDRLENIITLGLQSGSVFYISPLTNTNLVEIIINDKFLQIDKEYPYAARLNEKSLDPLNIHRQRFECVYQNNTITFKTKTDTGNRYLAFGKDNILRATGLMFNETVIKDYVHNCISITLPSLTANFIPKNTWVTYFFNYNTDDINRSLAVNKTISAPVHHLIDISIEDATSSQNALINIANLKTNVTPHGGPASVDNTTFL